VTPAAAQTARVETAYGAHGAMLPAVKLDFAAGEQLAITASSVVQSTAFDAEVVLVSVLGGDARIKVGASPTATTGAGSLAIADGAQFWLVKARTDKIAVIGGNGSTTGTVDLIPAAAAGE
jgi:hypothetical protein